MAEYLSNRQRKLNIGISSYTENQLVLDVIGNTNITGIVTAFKFYGDGSELTNVVVSIADTATNVVGGIASVSSLNVSGISTVGFLTGENAYFSGVITATNFYGNLVGNADSSSLADIASYASIAGISTYAEVAGIATYSFNAGISSYSGFSGIATYSEISGISTYAESTGISTYSNSSGIATNVIGGIGSITSLIVSGITTSLQGFVGNLTGIATTAINVVGGIGSLTFLSVSGVSTLRFLSGTDAYFSGIVTATQFIGNLSGIASYADFSGIATYSDVSGLSTTATNVIGGIGSLTNLSVSGISTFDSIEVINSEIDNLTNENISNSGIITTNNLDVLSGFDVYANSSVFHENVIIQGNLTVNGTEVILNVDENYIKDKQIILGFSTTNNVDDVTANGGGIAIASTEGNPLVCLQCTGINTLPGTYKQLIWTSANTFGVGTTDAFLFNYAVGIGSTLVPNGVRLAVGGVQITDDTINTSFIVGNDATIENLDVQNIIGISGSFSGIVTAPSFVGNLTGIASTAIDVIGGIASVNSLNVSGVSAVGFLSGTDAFFSGIVTAAKFVGDASGLSNVGFASTAIDVIGGIASVTSLNVSGISTVGFLTGTNAFLSGIVTATAFVGDASGLSNVGFASESDYSATAGIATYAENAGISTTSTNVIGGIASVTSLSVFGVSTLGTVEISSGIITATSGVVTYYGDGSNLTGVTGFNLVTEEIQTTPVYLTFVENIGVSSIGISTEKLSFIPSTGSLGIGTTNPASQLQVDGDVLVSGIVTATAFDGTVTTSTNVIGGIGSLSSLSVSGFSTFSNISVATSIFDSTNSSGVSQHVLTSTPSGILWQSVTAPGVGAIAGINVATSSEDSSFNIGFFNTGAGTTANVFVAPSDFTYNPLTNNVGIGTTSAIAKLDVRGTGNFIGTSYQFYGNTGFGTQGPLVPFPYFSIEPEFYEEGTLLSVTQPDPTDLRILRQILSLTGIGTTADSRLDYYGDAHFNSNINSPNFILDPVPSSSNPIRLSGTSGENGASAAFFSDGYGLLGISTNFSGDGNFTVNRSGIGTVTNLTESETFQPLMKVDESGFYNFFLDANSSRIKSERIFVSTSSTFFPLVFDNDYSSSYFTINSPTIGIGSTGNLTTSVTFNPIIDVKVDGNIGIGTTNPQRKLEVNGDLRVTSAGSTFTEQIDIRHYRDVSYQQLGITTDNRGAIGFDGANAYSGYAGNLLSLVNDNSGTLVSIHRYDSFPGIRTAFNIDYSGAINANENLKVRGNVDFSGGTVSIAKSEKFTFDVYRLSGVTTFRDGITAIGSSYVGVNAVGGGKGGQLITLTDDNDAYSFLVNRNVGINSLTPVAAGNAIITPSFSVDKYGEVRIYETYPDVLSSPRIAGFETGRVAIGDGDLFRIDSYSAPFIGSFPTINPALRVDKFGTFDFRRNIHQTSGIATVGIATTSTTLSINATMTFELVNNTTLNVKVRGTDGVTRVGILTLS